MMGKLSSQITEFSGLTPRVANLLFDVSRSVPEDHKFLFEASFLEIYNEAVHDLLNPDTPPESLKIRESPQLGVFITGLSKNVCTSATQICKTIVDGFGARTVSATAYNAESSRSHAVFEIVVSQKYNDKISGLFLFLLLPFALL